MVNAGAYDKPIEIWQDIAGTVEDELGNKKAVPTKVGETFANIKSLVGSLLGGRAAGTVVSKTTHKFTWGYDNFPEVIAGVHYIKYDGKRFDVDYALDEGFKHIELQVFCTVLS